LEEEETKGEKRRRKEKDVETRGAREHVSSWFAEIIQILKT